MKYVLGVGLLVEKYKKNPNVKIFLDDKLIDDFEITNQNCLEKVPHLSAYHYEPSDVPVDIPNVPDFQTIVTSLTDAIKKNQSAEVPKILKKMKTTTKNEMIDFLNQNSEPATYVKNHPGVKDWMSAMKAEKIPKCFKLYQIDEQELKAKTQISLCIKNDDSNASNGFLTRSTMVDLRHIFLIPIKYIKLFKDKGEKFWDNMKNIIPAEYNGIGQVMFNDYHSAAYPFPFRYDWNGKRTVAYLHGGNGTLTLKIVTKNNLTMFDPSSMEQQQLHWHIKKWIKKYVVEHPNQDVKFNGVSRLQGIEIATGKKDYPVFPFSRSFISLVSQGMFDKYLEDENK